jgi:hypothetical protein
MNKIEMQYKADTGERPYTRYESETLKSLRNNKRQILELDAFPEVYIDGDELLIPSPEYIKWLEEQLETLNTKH